MKTTLALLFTLALAVPAAAQDDSLSIRAFALGSVEQFTAIDTFDAVFGRTYEPFFGGGLQVLQGDYFLELTASRLNQTGQRAFINNGQKFRLGIPLTAKVTALEATAGYRYPLSRRVLPYGAAGVGLYRYTEDSAFDEAELGNRQDYDEEHEDDALCRGTRVVEPFEAVEVDLIDHQLSRARWATLGHDVDDTEAVGEAVGKINDDQKE